MAQGGVAVVAAASNMVSFGGGERDAPEVSTKPAPQQEVAITAPTCKYEAPMSELGCMAPPSFGNAARGGVTVSV
jgi:hypothetical protein